MIPIVYFHSIDNNDILLSDLSVAYNLMRPPFIQKYPIKNTQKTKDATHGANLTSAKTTKTTWYDNIINSIQNSFYGKWYQALGVPTSYLESICYLIFVPCAAFMLIYTLLAIKTIIFFIMSKIPIINKISIFRPAFSEYGRYLEIQRNNKTTVNDLRNELNKKTVGHDNIKQRLLYLIDRHFNWSFVWNDWSLKQLDKEGLLLIGKTGSGKTSIILELIRILEEKFNIPAILLDSARLVPPAYKGSDIDEALSPLKASAQRIAKRLGLSEVVVPLILAHSFVCLDEIDKITQKKEGLEKNLQNSLLSLIGEGGSTIKLDNSPMRLFNRTTISTQGMLFCALGAFDGNNDHINNINSPNNPFISPPQLSIECIIKQRLIKQNISNAATYSYDEIMKHLTSEDLSVYGLSQQLTDRFMHQCYLESFTEENYTELVKRILDGNKLELSTKNINLIWDQDLINQLVADLMMSNQNGVSVRTIKSKIKSLLINTIFRLYNSNSQKTIKLLYDSTNHQYKIDEEVINGN
jgi:ATP-dependent protease Clp ATPase subunit